MTRLTPEVLAVLATKLPAPTLYTTAYTSLGLTWLDIDNAPGVVPHTINTLVHKSLQLYTNRTGNEVITKELVDKVKDAVQTHNICDADVYYLFKDHEEQGITAGFTNDLASTLQRPSVESFLQLCLGVRMQEVYAHMELQPANLKTAALGILHAWQRNNLATATVEQLHTILSAAKHNNPGLQAAVQYLEQQLSASTTADTAASTTADTGASTTVDTGASTTADTGASTTADTGASM